MVALGVAGAGVRWVESMLVEDGTRVPGGGSGRCEASENSRRFRGPKTATIYVMVGPEFHSQATLRISANVRQEEGVSGEGQTQDSTEAAVATSMPSTPIFHTDRRSFKIQIGRAHV